jgi:hypothetical protein
MDAEHRFTAATVVAIWGAMNLVLTLLLIGFIAGGFGGHLFTAAIYGGAVVIVFTVAALVVLARRRHPRWRGLRVARRPAAVLLLAVGFTLLWFGLAFGGWVPMIAGPVFIAALGLEFYPSRG